MKLSQKTSGVIAGLVISLVTVSPLWAHEGEKSLVPVKSVTSIGASMVAQMTREQARGSSARLGRTGMMGSGMRDQDAMGHGMGPSGMMDPGMMGPGMMGRGISASGMRVVPMMHLSTSDVRHFLKHRLARDANERLKIGEVKEVDEDTILADIVTVDNSLVWRFKVDRHSGVVHKARKTTKSRAGMMSMKDPMAANAPVVPAVTGYSEGRKILFLHTETSDAKIAKILTDMMGSPVLVVPSLAKTPEEMLARVYVFTNGLKGDGPKGPLGFQPDVFDKPPGISGYSPLRKVVLVTWKDPTSAGLLKSAAEVAAAIEKGDLTSEEPGVVVNMPLITWPGGKR